MAVGLGKLLRVDCGPPTSAGRRPAPSSAFPAWGRRGTPCHSRVGVLAICPTLFLSPLGLCLGARHERRARLPEGPRMPPPWGSTPFVQCPGGSPKGLLWFSTWDSENSERQASSCCLPSPLLQTSSALVPPGRYCSSYETLLRAQHLGLAPRPSPRSVPMLAAHRLRQEVSWAYPRVAHVCRLTTGSLTETWSWLLSPCQHRLTPKVCQGPCRYWRW